MRTPAGYLDLRTALERLLLLEVVLGIAAAIIVLFTQFSLVYSAAQSLAGRGQLPHRVFAELFTEFTPRSIVLQGVVLLILCLALALTARIRRGMLTRGEYGALQIVSICELCLVAVLTGLAVMLYAQLLSIDMRYGVSLSIYEIPGLAACLCLTALALFTYVKTRQLLLLRLPPRRL